MILSDREIKAALTRDAIRITPRPEPDAEVWSSTALDLRLHERLGRWSFPKGKKVSFQPAEPDFDFNTMFHRHGKTVMIAAKGQVIKPGEFYLGWTMERIQLP